MLHSNNKIIILVIPPAIKTINDMKKQLDDTNVAFSNQDFYYLRDIVDGFSLVCNFYFIFIKETFIFNEIKNR